MTIQVISQLIDISMKAKSGRVFHKSLNHFLHMRKLFPIYH